MAQVRTLSDLTSVIADDLARDDLTTAISEAVSDAIQHYQSERFWFTESRTVEFDTISGQTIYTSIEEPELPTFIHLDQVWIERPGDQLSELKRILIREWEQYADGSASSGEPHYYAHFNEKLYLYPIPNDVYTIKITGHQGMVDGATAGTSFGIGAPLLVGANPYMKNAFELIRSHAKMLLYAHKLMEPVLAAGMNPAMQGTPGWFALSALRTETGARVGKGCIAPTQF